MGYEMKCQKTAPVAQKEYKCFECGKPIKKGEKHVKIVGSHDCGFYSERMHEGCDWYKSMPSPPRKRKPRKKVA